MGKRIKNTLIYVGIRIFAGLLRLLGLRCARRFCRWVGRRAWRLAGTERRRSLKHLAWAFPEMAESEREALGRRSFAHLGEGLAEVVCASRISDWDAYADFEPGSRELLTQAMGPGKGVVLVSGHIGNWEIMGRALVQHGFPMNVIGKKSYDPRLTRLLVESRRQAQIHIIWRGEADIFQRMLDVLDSGQVLGLLIDQDTRVPSVFVPFFGKLAATSTAPATLARHTGTPMVCCFNHRREDGGMRISVQRILPSELEDKEQALLEDTRALSACIEAHIRAHPTEWIWMHRRWKTRPPGAQ